MMQFYVNNLKSFLTCGVACVLFLCSCSKASFSKDMNIEDAYFNGKIHLEKNKKLGRYCLSIHNLKTGGKDRIFTPYEVFTMETGDINGDGRTDICLGITKPTPFDSVLKKRLFIFQIDKDYIRPLWLSSRLVKPLEDFRVITHKDSASTVLTIEKDKKHSYSVNEYRWASFGMHLITTHGASLSFADAQKILLNHKSKFVIYE